MNNRLIRKKPNRFLQGRNNYFSDGGRSNLSKDPNLFSNLLQNEQVQKAVGTAVGQIGGGLIGGGLQSGIGNTISGLSGLVSAIPGPVGTIASAGLGLVGGLTNRMFGSKMNDSNIAKVEQNINQLNSFQSNASDYDTLTSNYLSAPVGMTFNNSYIGKDGWFSNKAKNKANDLRQQINTGNTWVQNSLANNALNIQNQQMTNLLSNYAAYGGNLYKDGGPTFNPFTKTWFYSNGKPMSKRRFDKNWGGYTVYTEDGYAVNYTKNGREIGRRKGTQTPSITGRTRNIQQQEYFNRDREFTDSVKAISKRYGLNPNLVASRMAREGIDYAIQDYNNSGGTNLISNSNSEVYTKGPLWGLDHITSNIEDGSTRILEPWVQYTPTLFYNEKDQETVSANFNKWSDAISGTAAELRGRRDRLRKKYPNLNSRQLDAAASASFNLGERGVERAIKNGTYMNYAPFITLHANGGPLMSNGSIFDTGINYVGNGGIHEENPYEGVPMGIDEEGTPNLVEEGEVIWNDYVFSNRLKVPKKVRQKYKLGGNKKLTFADAALKLSKESEERPNDPISQRGLDNSMNMLMQEQEVIRQQTDPNKFAKGGKFGRVYAGEIGDPDPQFLDLVTGTDTLNQGLGPINQPFTWAPEYSSQQQESPVYTRKGIVLNGYTSNPTVLPPGYTVSDVINFQQPNRSNVQPSINNNKKNTSTNTNTTTDKKSNIPTWMRYTPIYANGVLSLTDALGLTNQPNYYEASQLQNAAINAANYTPTRHTPIGNYLTYKPYDINYGINNLNSALGLQRRALLNNIGSNRAQAAAYLLASDNQYLGQIGDLYKSAEEYNQTQRQKVEEFNRATNSANAEGAMKAAAANAEAREKAQALYLSGLEKASEIRQAERAQSAAARSTNMSNFINSIADMGRENFARNMIVDNPANYYSINSDGTIDYKAPFYDLPKEQQDYIVGHATRNSQTKANGGYLTIKRKRK